MANEQSRGRSQSSLRSWRLGQSSSQRGFNRANRSNQNPQPQLRQLLTNDVVVGSNDGADITIGGEEAFMDPSVDNADGVASERGPDRERDRDRSESSETSPSRDNFNANPYDRASSQRRMREIRRRDNLHNAQQQQGHQSNVPENSANRSDDSSQSVVGQLHTTNPTRGNDGPESNLRSVNTGREIRNPDVEIDSGNSNTRDPDAGWPAHVLNWIKDVRK